MNNTNNCSNDNNNYNNISDNIICSMHRDSKNTQSLSILSSSKDKNDALDAALETLLLVLDQRLDSFANALRLHC
jgi:hypothetical protein